ncbi:MAG: acyl carrier protein [Clostridiaceae bacterium]|nr:acyl carrier protein [Clostridiaceae bacterium]
MEKIKVKGKLYEIRSIQTIEPHVMQIVFVGTPPTKWGDITLYTDGGIECATLTGWTTVYRDEGQTVYLSDDSSVYQTPDPDSGEVLPPEPYVPTLAELQSVKKREISQACERIIYSGVDVTFTDGSVEHFSLTEHDQLNLFGKQVQLAAGAEQLEYHSDGQPCRYYSAADMQTIIAAAMQHVSYHTTYCNAVNMWIAGCESTEEVQAIYYGADVPEEYQSDVLKAYIASMKESAGDENAQAAE